MKQVLTQRQKAILIGTLLGDGHLRHLKRECRLEAVHSGKQKEYLFWKYAELQDWILSEPHYLEIKDRRYGKIYEQWRFRTKSNIVFSEMWRLFYRKKKKIVPLKIRELLKSPISLAVWFMDDGGRRNDSYGLFLNTLSFSKKDNQLLSNCLERNFGIKTRLHWIKDGFRLYIPSSEAKKFCTIISPYIHRFVAV